MDVVFVKEENMDMKEEAEEEQYIEISPHSMSKNDHSEKSKALTKHEIRRLLELILQNPVITSKETNATSNQQKVLAWNQVTGQFNATYGVLPRTSRQLRLKWENLKKAARRRNAQIRSNRDKTDLTAEFVPRDEILERVSTLLRRNRRAPAKSQEDEDEGSDSSDDTPLANERSQPEGRLSGPFIKELDEVVMTVAGRARAAPETNGALNRRRNGRLQAPLMPLRKKVVRSDEGREARNRAIAAYYTAKTKLTEANLTNILLQNEKLQLEIGLLKKKQK